ncbi:MAG: hypothetical protein AAFW65_05005 [Pseudomonadota bacterium]
MTDIIQTQESSGTRLPLSASQIVTMAIFGAVLWLLAAFTLRYLGPMGVYEGMSRAVLYALIVPGTVPFVLLARRIGGLASNQIGIAYAVGTTSAMLLDGLALAWFPALYGGTPDLVAGAGAAILWGAGVGQLIAFLFNRTSA